MQARVLIVDDTIDTCRHDATQLKGYSDIVTLFWLSPEGREKLERLTSAKCHSLLEVVGGLDRWERSAFDLTRRVSEEGPKRGGRPWRSTIEESLYRESLVIQAAVDAGRFCRRLVHGSQAQIDAIVSAPLERVLRSTWEQNADQVDVHCLTPSGVPATRPGVVRRLSRRVRHAWLTGGWQGQAWDLLAEADRDYSWRRRLERYRPIPEVEPEGVTFFSSYVNNSRNLRVVENLMPLPVNWVVLNYNAGQGAKPAEGSVHRLWRFLPRNTLEGEDPEDFSQKQEVEEPLGSWLSWSPTWRYWTRAGSKAAGLLTACWDNYLRRARPRLLVTASQWGIEGWLMARARKQGIPTLQLLHGVLAGYFHTGRAVESDAMVVWGEFWRDIFPEEERSKIQVANPGNVMPLARPPASRETRPRQITYFSKPLSGIPLYNAYELQTGMIDVLCGLKESTGCRVCIRAHPLENVGDFVEHWRRRAGSFPLDIELSQYEPLENVLQRTDIALMYRSTILLDCRLNGIPAVLPGWIDYGWSSEIRRVDGVHFAESFGDIRSVLQSWISRPPHITTGRDNKLVSPIGAGVEGFRSIVENLLGQCRDNQNTNPA